MLSADEARSLSIQYSDPDVLILQNLLDYIQSQITDACRSGQNNVDIIIPAVCHSTSKTYNSHSLITIDTFTVSQNKMYYYLKSHELDIISLLSKDLGYQVTITLPEQIDDDLISIYHANVHAEIMLSWN